MASGQFNAAMVDQDWTLVNDGSSAACALDVDDATSGVEQLHVSAPLESVPMTPLYPSIPADPKITEALEQMMSMGYGNEGGWLTQLLVAHNGDIGRALDAIHAKK
jgi:sequestosome 1